MLTLYINVVELFQVSMLAVSSSMVVNGQHMTMDEAIINAGSKKAMSKFIRLKRT